MHATEIQGQTVLFAKSVQKQYHRYEAAINFIFLLSVATCLLKIRIIMRNTKNITTQIFSNKGRGYKLVQNALGIKVSF